MILQVFRVIITAILTTLVVYKLSDVLLEVYLVAAFICPFLADGLKSLIFTNYDVMTEPEFYWDFICAHLIMYLRFNEKIMLFGAFAFFFLWLIIVYLYPRKQRVQKISLS